MSHPRTCGNCGTFLGSHEKCDDDLRAKLAAEQSRVQRRIDELEAQRTAAEDLLYSERIRLAEQRDAALARVREADEAGFQVSAELERNRAHVAKLREALEGLLKSYDAGDYRISTGDHARAVLEETK